MKFKIVFCITAAFIFMGCSLEEIEDREAEVITLQSEIDNQKNNSSLGKAEQSTQELDNNSIDNSFALCPSIVQRHRIKWDNEFITDEQKEGVRQYFERFLGKHPLAIIDPDGVHETWNFDLSQVTDPESINERVPCGEADDVVRSAIVNEEEIELDD